jgi:hypothetical protein
MLARFLPLCNALAVSPHEALSSGPLPLVLVLGRRIIACRVPSGLLARLESSRERRRATISPGNGAGDGDYDLRSCCAVAAQKPPSRTRCCRKGPSVQWTGLSGRAGCRACPPTLSPLTRPSVAPIRIRDCHLWGPCYLPTRASASASDNHFCLVLVLLTLLLPGSGCFHPR